MKTAVATARLEVRLLGRFELALDGRPVHLASRPAQSLLAYLALTSGTMHRRERLATLLWPDADEENGRTYLRQALWRIRKALAPADRAEPQFVISDDLSVGWDPGANVWLDAAAFERADDATTEELARSTDAYGGPLLPGFEDEWVLLERQRLEAVLPRRMDRLIERLSADGKWEEVIERAERWIALGGTPESAYRALMHAHHARGDRARVAAAYRRCADALRRDLDVEPSAETRQLYSRLRASDVPSASSEAEPVPTSPEPVIEVAVGSDAPPFKGLHHFDEGDADLFFGREALVSRMAERLRTTSFLALIGASGSGKSSIVRAGLVPALRRDHRVYVLTPTAHPLESLAAALTATASTRATAALLADLGADPRSLRLHLRKMPGRTYVVVDQFEELFTLCRDPFEREAFIDDLLGAGLPVGEAPASVVIALRADFYSHCADHAALRDAVAAHQEYIGPMDAGELRRAIEQPAATLGWSFESGLVDVLLRQAGDEPGALPLLSHALLETWQRRRGRTLTHEGYAASGGIDGAIARTAERVFAALTPAQQQLARRIFLRLTEFGEGTQDTRRRASMEELRSGGVEPSAVNEVVRILADARLVTTAESSVDVAHEALIREWPRLRQWLDEDRDALRAHRALTRAALEWERLGSDPDALYRGARLAQGLELGSRAPEELNLLERSFLEASRGRAEAELRERDAARIRELEAAQRLAAAERSAAVKLRRRALYLTLALLFLVGMAGAALWFAGRANSSAAAAEHERQRALLESARSAAASVDSRLQALRDALTATSGGDLVYLARTSDPSLRDVLSFMQRSAGDVVLLAVDQYRSGETIASGGYTFEDRPRRERTVRAREAVAGSLTESERRCAVRAQLGPASVRWSQVHSTFSTFFVSTPYVPSAGEAPSVAMAKYDEGCEPYRLIAEVSLRRANEWMVRTLAPDDDAYLVDASGRLLAQARRSDPEHFRDLTGSDLLASARTALETSLRRAPDPFDGRPRLVAAAGLSGTGWTVIVVRPDRGIDVVSDAVTSQLGPVGVAVIVVLAIVLAVADVRVRRRRASPTRGAPVRS